MALVAVRRSPYGERGLKYAARDRPAYDHLSLSLRGAWIEISASGTTDIDMPVALLTGSVD